MDSWFLLKNNKVTGCCQGLYSITFSNNWIIIDLGKEVPYEIYLPTCHPIAGGPRVYIIELNTITILESLKMHTKCGMLTSNLHSDIIYVREWNILVFKGIY